MQYIAFDSHKRYTFASIEGHATGKIFDGRIDHERGALREFLSACEAGSAVAVETIGNWYWIVDEIEAAGMNPQLVHARKPKMMLASSKKTDKLDAHGINRLQRVGTLPTVWIPDGALRDRCELFRTRMTFTHRRTSTKNRIHATLAKYGNRIEDSSDIFNNKGRVAVEEVLPTLPEHSQFAAQVLLNELDELEAKIKAFEERITSTFSDTEEIKLLRTIPGIGFILGEVIASEIGDISRLATAARLASYAGTAPNVHASGGKYRYGRTPADTNHYLKWAYVEAANTITRLRRRLRYRHVADLYDRIRSLEGHSIVIGAVSRHLAEASWAILTKKEPYREPVRKKEAVSYTNW